MSPMRISGGSNKIFRLIEKNVYQVFLQGNFLTIHFHFLLCRNLESRFSDKLSINKHLSGFYELCCISSAADTTMRNIFVEGNLSFNRFSCLWFYRNLSLCAR